MLSILLKCTISTFFLLSVVLPKQMYAQNKAVLCQPWLIHAYNLFVNEHSCDPDYFFDDPHGPTIQSGVKDGIEYIHIRKLVFYPPPFQTFYYISKYYTPSGVYLGDGTLDSQGNGFLGGFEENEELLYHCADPYPVCDTNSILCTPCVQEVVDSWPYEEFRIVYNEVCHHVTIISSGIDGNPPFPWIYQQYLDLTAGCAEPEYDPVCFGLDDPLIFDGTKATYPACDPSICDTEIEMVQGVECILPMVVSTREVLHICEEADGVAFPDLQLGEKAKIGYTGHDGCISFCQQGIPVFIGCAEQSTRVNDASESQPYCIYPNPATGYIHFEGDQNRIESMEVWSLDGRLVIPKTKFEGSLDIQSLKPSVYMLKVNEKSGQIRYLKILKI